MKKLASSYACSFKHRKDDKFVSPGGLACWSQIMTYYDSKAVRYIKGDEFLKAVDNYIYIHDFRTEETNQYVELLVNTINEITECSIVTIDNIEYIKYKLLPKYDQNLILLNFIRSLWYDHYKPEYCMMFFKLLTGMDNEDPMERLSRAHKETMAVVDMSTYGYGHSNVPFNSKTFIYKIKNKEQLLKYTGYSTPGFFTND